MNVTFEDLLGPSEVVCCSGEGLNDRSRDSGGVATKAVLASEVQLISCFVARHFAQFSREKVEGWEGVTLEELSSAFSGHLRAMLLGPGSSLSVYRGQCGRVFYSEAVL